MSQDLINSATFCVLPWMHLATNSSGQFRVCCHAQPGIGLIRDETGRVLRIDKNSLEEVWNSASHKALRLQMARGERPELCKRCFREEDSGVKSFRQSMNERHAVQLAPQLSAGGEAPVNVRYVDLRLGNLCNLRCRMCNPFASNQWLKDWNEVATPKIGEDDLQRLSRMTWPEDPRVWELVEKVLDSVEEIYLTGGEPTLIQQQIPLLEKCIARGVASRITLKYNTNLTYVPEKLLRLWSEFQRIRLNCSIDAYGALNEFIRYPTVWSDVDRNLRRLVELAKTYRFEIQVHATVQAYNLHALPELFRYLEEFQIFPYLNILDRPEYLNVRLLPEAYKARAAQGLQPYLEKPKVESLIGYLREDWTHLIPEFRRFNGALDRRREESLRALAPELAHAVDL